MKVRYLMLKTIAIILACCFSCQVGDGKIETPGSDDHTVIEVKLCGHVKSVTTGDFIPAVTINANGNQVFSDSNGYFEIECLNENSIKIQMPGYADFQRPLSNFKSSCNDIEFYLKPVDVTKTIDPSLINTIMSKDGASVTFPVLGGIDEELIVSLTNFNVSTEDLNCVPGDFSAINNDGTETKIVSQGMIDVSILGASSGNIYSLEDQNTTFDITIPITGDLSGAPSTIPMWYFNANKCKWIESGTLTKAGDFYKGTVTHFTTWNADYKFSGTSISGTISDTELNATYMIRQIFNGFMNDFYETQKSFKIVNVPQNTNMRIEIIKSGTGEIWSKSFTTNANANDKYLGTFPEAGYVQEVRGLKAIVSGQNVNISWNYEPANLKNVELTLETPGVAPIVVLVNPGMMQYQFNNLTVNGVYTLTAKSVLNNNDKSGGVIKNIKISTYCSLAINKNLEYGTILVKINNDPTGFLYTGILEIPINSKLELLAEIENQYGIFMQWNWDPDYISGDNPIIFNNVSADFTVDAVFQRPQ